MFDFDELLNLTWLDKVSCAELDEGLFFVEAGHVINETTLEVCRGCPVRRECVEHAYRLSYTSGYFGGLSPGQRRQLSLADAFEFIRKDPPKTVAPERAATG